MLKQTKPPLQGPQLAEKKTKFKTNLINRIKRHETETSAIILAMVLHAPTAIAGKMTAWTYSTGKQPFEETLLRVCTLIKKARESGPQSVVMNFNDNVGEFMGQLDPGLSHAIEDLTTELAKGDEEISKLESELAELYDKPMDLEARHAVEQVARAEFKKALMVVTAAWKDAEFTLPEHQVPRNSAEDIQEASME